MNSLDCSCKHDSESMKGSRRLVVLETMYHRARPKHFAFLLEESNARGREWVREDGIGMRGKRQVCARLGIGAREVGDRCAREE